jgi:hypothetical protein
MYGACSFRFGHAAIEDADNILWLLARHIYPVKAMRCLPRSGREHLQVSLVRLGDKEVKSAICRWMDCQHPSEKPNDPFHAELLSVLGAVAMNAQRIEKIRT